MAESLGTAVLELETDQRKLDKQLGQVPGKAADAGGKAGRSFGSTLQKGVLPAVAALGLVVAGVKKTTDAASNLNESQNAVNTVFGESARKLHAFSKIAATEAGLSMRAFNELVTPVGASLTNLGFSQDEAADASINLAKRAADMASVFGGDVSGALEAIQAGLRGEADPLERFGVGLSESAVQAHALELGLAKTAKELTPNQKAQARLALLMEQTDKVSGDFVRTSGDLANAQRKDAAEAENMQAKMGQGLLPVMDMYQAVLRGVTGFLGDHTTAAKVGAAVVTALAGGLLLTVGAMKVYKIAAEAARLATLLFNSALFANPIGLIVLALIALGVGLVIAWKKSETFRDIVLGAFDRVKEIARGLARWFKEDFVGFFRDAWQKIEDLVFDAVNWILDKFLWFAGKYIGLAEKAFGWIPGVGDKIGDLKDEIDDLRAAAKLAAARRYAIRFVSNAAFVKSDIEDLRAGLFTSFGGGGDGVVSVPVGFRAANPGGLSPSVLDELGAAQAMGLTLTSGYRPGAVTSTGNPSLHGIGKAIDVAGPASRMSAFFRAMVGNRGIRELLYSPVGGWYGGGGIVPLSGSVLRDHFDHVHVGVYDSGGFLPPGVSLAVNNTGRPERVVGPGGAAPVTFNFPHYVGDKSELMSAMREAVSDYSLRNGESPF